MTIQELEQKIINLLDKALDNASTDDIPLDRLIRAYIQLREVVDNEELNRLVVEFVENTSNIEIESNSNV